MREESEVKPKLAPRYVIAPIHRYHGIVATLISASSSAMRDLISLP